MSNVYAQMGSDLSPPWLDENGTKYLYALSTQISVLAEALRMGVLQRFPSYCLPEALPHIGADRQIRRGINESDDAYKGRLRNAFQTWKKAGSPLAVLDQIAQYYAPNAPVLRYVVNGVDENGTRVTDWWTLDNGEFSYHRANPSNWNWDGTFPAMRFWIIVYTPTLTPWTYGSGHAYGDGNSYGFLGTNQFIQDIRALTEQWKAAGSHAGTFDLGCDAGIIFAGSSTQDSIKYGDAGLTYGSGHVYGETYTVGLFAPTLPPGSPMPDGTWDDPANRDPSALYLSGT